MKCNCADGFVNATRQRSCDWTNSHGQLEADYPIRSHPVSRTRHSFGLASAWLGIAISPNPGSHIMPFPQRCRFPFLRACSINLPLALILHIRFTGREFPADNFTSLCHTLTDREPTSQDKVSIPDISLLVPLFLPLLFSTLNILLPILFPVALSYHKGSISPQNLFTSQNFCHDASHRGKLPFPLSFLPPPLPPQHLTWLSKLTSR